MPTPEEITRHWYDEPIVERVAPPRPSTEIVIAEYDERWPELAAIEMARIAEALGAQLVSLEHVGSTSVPGLPAKPILDLDLTVHDPVDEPAYIPLLEQAGYEFTWREPTWHQHRLLNRFEPEVNLHVFGPESPELVRHRMLRDWLRTHPDDRAAYASAKRAAAATVNDTARMNEYNTVKEPFIRDLLDRIFRAEGLLQ